MNIPGSFQPVVNLMYNNVDEMALPLESVAGFATLNFGPLPRAGATPTGLANDATLYYVKHQVDAAGSATEISFAGSTAQTFADLITALGAIGGTTAALVGGEVVIASNTTGTTSKVIITPGTTGADLLASVRSGAEVYLRSNEHQKGHTKYLRWGQLDTLEQTEMGVIMNTLDPSDVEWTHASASMSIVKDVLGPLSMFEPVGVAAGVYTLDVTVDSVTKTVSFDVDGGATIDNAYESFARAMRVDFPAASVAEEQTDANTLSWVVTTSTPGTAGNVTVAAGTGADFIAAVTATSLTAAAVAPVAGIDGVAGTTGDGTPIAATHGYQDVTVAETPAATGTTVTALGAGSYTFNATIDGVAHAGVSITTAGGETYDAIAALMQTALQTATGAADTVTFVTSPAPAFRVTSFSTGVTSTVAVTDGTLFAAIAAADTAVIGFATAVQGADAIADANFWSLLTTTKAPNGFPVLSSVGPLAIFEREDKPQKRFLTKKDATYWNGSAWVVWTA